MIIKKHPLDVAAYAHKLAQFIREKQMDYFKEYEATAWQDYDYWPDKIVSRNRLVMPDEHLLIDRKFEGEHWYVICRISKSKDNQRVKHIYPVIRVGELEHWRNGYFLLPNLEEK
jgi:hypothetical protein